MKGSIKMILVLLGVSILIFAASVIYFCVTDEDSEVVAPMLGGIGALGFVICLVATVWLCIDVSELKVIDEKIAMYEEENQKIETQIAETVQEYQQYESGVISKVAPESVVTLVALYPDLKADTLVKEQIEVYLANNEKIKSLKEQDITGNVKRWWLYFGGKSE